MKSDRMGLAAAARLALGLAGLVCLFAAGSCGSSKTDYSYTFAETGVCATGNMKFTSLQAMCTSLQSDSVNMNCALAARMAFFTDHCPGTFVEAP